MEPVTLSTRRLTLSTPVPGDRPQVYEYCQDPLFAEYMTLPRPYTADDAVFFLETLVPNGWRDEREFTWALREEPGTSLLGVVGMRVQPEPRTVDVGYWLGSPYRGKGYMSESVRRAVEWAFEALPVDRVLWECVAGNHASVRVAAASGFGYTGDGPARGVMYDGGHPPAWHGELRRDGDPAEARDSWPIRLFGETG